MKDELKAAIVSTVTVATRQRLPFIPHPSSFSSMSFNVGDRIRLHTRPPFLKTAENMPMLRPPDLVDIGEEGTVFSRKPGGYLGVRFSRGSFLIDAQYIEAIEGADTRSDE